MVIDLVVIDLVVIDLVVIDLVVIDLQDFIALFSRHPLSEPSRKKIFAICLKRTY